MARMARSAYIYWKARCNISAELFDFGTALGIGYPTSQFCYPVDVFVRQLLNNPLSGTIPAMVKGFR